MIAIRLYWLLLAGLMMVNGPHANATDLIPIALNWNVEPKLDVNWRTEVEVGKLDLDVRNFDSPLADVRLNAAQKLLRSLQHPSLDKKVLSDAIARRLEKGETQRAVQKALVSSLCEVDGGSHTIVRVKGDKEPMTVVDLGPASALTAVKADVGQEIVASGRLFGGSPGPVVSSLIRTGQETVGKVHSWLIRTCRRSPIGESCGHIG